TRLAAELIEVTAVQPDALDFHARLANPRGDRGRTLDTAYRVVSINQQRAESREARDEIAERVALAFVRHHEAVTHRAENRNAVTLAGEHVGGTMKARHVARTRRDKRRVRTLCASRT